MRTYSKFVVVVGAIAALAVPAVAMADPATNPSTNDAVGFCISNNNGWSNLTGSPSTGDLRSSMTGAEVSAGQHLAKDICGGLESAWAGRWTPPGQAK